MTSFDLNFDGVQGKVRSKKIKFSYRYFCLKVHISYSELVCHCDQPLVFFYNVLNSQKLNVKRTDVFGTLFTIYCMAIKKNEKEIFLYIWYVCSMYSFL